MHLTRSYSFTCIWVIVVATLVSHECLSQEPKPSELAEAIIRNATTVRQYSWKMRVDWIVKGESEKTSLYEMSFDADGQLQRTSIEEGEEEKKSRSPLLRGRQEKIYETRALIGSLTYTTNSYLFSVPTNLRPFMGMAQVSKDTGVRGGAFRIEGTNYLQVGDVVQIWVDKNTHKPVKAKVNTRYNGNPLLISADHYKGLPDGPNYPARITATDLKNNIRMVIENSDFARAGE